MERKWILVVDDEIDIRQNFLDLIQDHAPHYAVVTAKDGAEALQKVQIQKFDCIITDLNMPKMDGANLIHSLKSSAVNGVTPIIIVTAYPDDKLLKIHDFLWQVEKPVQFDELLDLIDRQVALGPVNKRLPAQLVNAVLNSLISVLKKVKADPKVESPYLRNKGDDLKGQQLLTMQLRFRDTANFWFTIGLERSDLNLSNFTSHFFELLGLFPGLEKEISVVSNAIVQRSQLDQACLLGYKGLRFKIESTLGTIYLESIAGQELVLDYVSNPSIKQR